jgi:putative sensory transduction regulator
MPAPDSSAVVLPTDVERWLGELGLEAIARADRDGVTSWDLRLDGRRRFDLPVTLILDPALALICWVHFAPPIGDAYRKSYRKLLRWNDEFPFVKFSLAEDERPVLATELPIATLDRDELGLALARSLAIADQLLEETAGWLWVGGRIPDHGGRVSRGLPLLARYVDRLGELLGGEEPASPPARSEPEADVVAAG